MRTIITLNKNTFYAVLKESKLVMQPLLIISQMGPEINLPKLRQS